MSEESSPSVSDFFTSCLRTRILPVFFPENTSGLQYALEKINEMETTALGMVDEATIKEAFGFLRSFEYEEKFIGTVMILSRIYFENMEEFADNVAKAIFYFENLLANDPMIGEIDHMPSETYHEHVIFQSVTNLSDTMVGGIFHYIDLLAIDGMAAETTPMTEMYIYLGSQTVDYAKYLFNNIIRFEQN